MDINQRTAKIPFWILYCSVTSNTLFDLTFTYLFLNNNPEAHEGNPLHAYFVSIIGLEYFLFLMPISLLALYGAIKLGAWIIRRVDKHTEINGENYIAVILILFTFPNVLINEILRGLFGRQVLRLSFDLALIVAIALVTVYIALTEMADRKFKNKQTENTQTSS
jgi:hypothetical protein